ncbi:DUF1517 domain-containing protein [Leptolyngbya sp. AN02str]|uniref:DUF1517 domain-containing protein n=1 Tax=Leptolyngbya sp. AN02str TaxID=3423363 RepID=UPI003D315A40
MNTGQRVGRVSAVAIALLVWAVGTVPFTGNHPSNWLGDRAEASTSGGRGRGGSFGGSSPSRPSGGRSGGSFGGPSRPYNPPSGWDRPNDYSYPRSGPVIVRPYPGPVVGPSTGSGGGLDFIFLLLVLGFFVLPIVTSYLRLGTGGAHSASPYRTPIPTDELNNHIFTVTRLQVALLAQARSIQSTLNQLTERANLDTPMGRSEALRETVLALLRSPENWTHVRAESKTVHGQAEASQLFEQLSIEERSKFDVESLVNVGGKVYRRDRIHRDEDPASYIVVTLLLGTADDQPLFADVKDASKLTAALRRVGAILPNYLLIYEYLWSPQDEADSLTYDELLTNYPNMVQL